MKYLTGRFQILLYVTVFMAGFFLMGFNAQAADRVQPVGEEIVIVIDPGHGGSQNGTMSGHALEKDMTMITAKAMYDELQKYDNVRVYLTHSEDVEMSLKERAEFAASVNADFLYSIHYNASENHTMFGTEVWISCEAPYNAYGYQFGYLHLEHMQDMGLFLRGVKNRQNDEMTDYYGIIRESVALEVPAVIIEHCYVDEERDAAFVENEEDFAAFGRADALSVAQYFGLKSSALGVDYSAEAAQLIPADANKVNPYTLIDRSNPDICEIELTYCDYKTGEVQLTVRAADYDSPLIYYRYTIDGGTTWSRLESWPGSNALTGEYTDTFQLNLEIPANTRPRITVQAFNLFDLDTKSNTLTFDQTFLKTPETTATPDNTSAQSEHTEPATEPVTHAHDSIGTTTFMPVYGEDAADEEPVGIMTFLKLCLVLVIILFLVVLTSQAVHYHKRKNRRHKR